MFNRKKTTPWNKIVASASAVPKKPLYGGLGGLAAMVGGIFAYKKFKQSRAPA